MELNNSNVLITGANRGLGREFARQAVERGAGKVYAAARRPEAVDLPGVIPVHVDITDQSTVMAAAEVCSDVDILVNNAGISTWQNLVDGDLDLIRSELDTHFWGTLAMTRAFAPILGRNGGGAIVNVMSVLSFVVYPGNGGYAAAKAAELALTNSTRLELAPQGTQVLGLHMGSTDTDVMAAFDIPKNDPADVVAETWDALEAGADEVLADADTRKVKALLSKSPGEVHSIFVEAANVDPE